MTVAYLSPHLSTDNTGGTLVAKSNLRMVETLFGGDVVAYAVSRTPMDSVLALDATRSTAGTAWANLQGLCATLTASGRRQFLEDVRLRQPDLVWLDTSLFGRLINDIRQSAPNVRIVSYFHNAEIDLLTQRLRGGALHYLPAWLATRSNELHSARNADAVMSITASDRARIGQLYGRTAVYTLPVSLCCTETTAKPWQDSDEVLFVGSDFGPNIEGLKFLNREVAPLLKNKRILVAGKGLARHLEGNIHPRLKMLGFVDDLSEVYARSRASLAPIFSGGGMKVKIAESLMHACPVIATSFAAIGYEDAGNNSILRVDSAAAFARAIEEWTPAVSGWPAKDFKTYYSFEANLARVVNMLHDIGVRY